MQIQILTAARLQRELGMSVIFVTHDIGVVTAEISDRLAVSVMAARSSRPALCGTCCVGPAHPYTRGLLASNAHGASKGGDWKLIFRLAAHPRCGAEGLRFRDLRCAVAEQRCSLQPPPVVAFADGRMGDASRRQDRIAAGSMRSKPGFRFWRDPQLPTPEKRGRHFRRARYSE